MRFVVWATHIQKSWLRLWLCPLYCSVFGTSRLDKKTDNDGKRNNYVQTQFSFDVFTILWEIANKQLLYINLTQYSVLLTRLFGCVAGDVSLQNRYWYFVSDYDIKQYVKTFFFYDQLF